MLDFSGFLFQVDNVQVRCSCYHIMDDKIINISGIYIYINMNIIIIPYRNYKLFLFGILFQT